MEPEPGRLGVGEFAFPGPLHEQLVAAIIGGTKTTTTGLLADHELDAEPLPRPGDRQAVIDSAEIPVALIKIAGARVVRVGDIDLPPRRRRGGRIRIGRRVAIRARKVLGIPASTATTVAIPRSQ